METRATVETLRNLLRARQARAAGEKLQRDGLGPLPADPRQLRRHPLSRAWWYYSVELLPDVVMRGIYRPELPMLPRIMLRDCDLAGMDCLDIGTMEGLIPTLMARRGAARVLAVDAIDHCAEKLAAVKHYYDVSFDYRTVGTMYDLDKKLPDEAFDLINCSGLLYHVFSPLHVLAGVRPLVRRNGIIIVSTCVVIDDGFSLEFNDGGKLQEERNTFWYFSPKLLDYVLRYLKLAPVDAAFTPYERYRPEGKERFDRPTGYASVVCRAVDDVLPTRDDGWMSDSARDSWEHLWLVDWERAERHSASRIRYTAGANGTLSRRDLAVPRRARAATPVIDLWETIRRRPPLAVAEHPETHLLRLGDIS